jgi:hypothetical protein
MLVLAISIFSQAPSPLYLAIVVLVLLAPDILMVLLCLHEISKTPSKPGLQPISVFLCLRHL